VQGGRLTVRCIRRHALFAQVPCKFASPVPQRRLLDIEPHPLFAHGLDDHVPEDADFYKRIGDALAAGRSLQQDTPRLCGFRVEKVIRLDYIKTHFF
jgi:hypothetical protein